MKRKKNVRQRGSKTHGWGAMKKHRGAGNRGGRGNAGSGKRADQKKPSYWNAQQPKGQKYGKDYFGKSGFHSITAQELTIINVQDLNNKIAVWATEKKVTKSGDKYTVDLKALGYDKLLGTGKISSKVNVTVSYATASAVEKVNAAGGSVTVTTAEKVAAE
jgi:large subunit ribosomal protein L15